MRRTLVVEPVVTCMVKQIQQGGGHDRPRPLFELLRGGSEEGGV